MTVCTKCIHYRHIIKNPAAPDVWYNHFCAAPEVRRDQDVSPIDGSVIYVQKNDLGRVVEAEGPFPYCRDINHGKCPHWVALEAM